MLLGDNENVNGSHGIDILKGKNVFVLVNLCGGDLSRNYFTKNAIHNKNPFSFFISIALER